MARIIDHSNDPEWRRKMARTSQGWTFIDPATFEKMKRAGAIRRAVTEPAPADADPADEPASS
jgi:hypothetical protein